LRQIPKFCRISKQKWTPGSVHSNITGGCYDRLWSLHPWRYSKLHWRRPWANCHNFRAGLALSGGLD